MVRPTAWSATHPSRYRGFEQALGERPFVDDMRVPGMLHGAHGAERTPARQDATRLTPRRPWPCRALCGFLRQPMFPGQRGTGLNYPDLPIFVAVGETTCCVGDFLAMVVADTAFHARQAADKVKVDYKVLQPVTDPFAALEPGAPQVHAAGNLHVHDNLLESTAFSRGDVEAGFAASTHIDRADLYHATGRTSFSRAGGLPGAAPRRRRQSVLAEPGLHVRPETDRRVLNLPPEKVEIAAGCRAAEPLEPKKSSPSRRRRPWRRFCCSVR